VGCLVATGMASLAYYVWRPSPLAPLPGAEEIAALHVELLDIGWGLDARSFELPRDQYENVLAALQPLERSPTSKELYDDRERNTVMRFSLRLKSEREIEIAVLDAGQTSICFAVDGISCTRGGPYCPHGGWLGYERVGIDEAGCLYQYLWFLHCQDKDSKCATIVRTNLKCLEIARGDRNPQRSDDEE
jgi:hypothetical protein